MNAPFLLSGGLAGFNPLEWRRATEARIEALHDAMLNLIAALDMLDGDPDLEPSICGGRDLGGVVEDDREGGDVLDEGEPNDWDDEDNGDEEPSLGWCEGQGGSPQ